MIINKLNNKENKIINIILEIKPKILHKKRDYLFLTWNAKDFVKKEINCLYSLDEYVKLTPTGLWDKRNMDSYDALVCALYE